MSARRPAKRALRLLTFPAGPLAGAVPAKGDPVAPVFEAARALCELSPKSFDFMSGLIFDMLSVFDADQAAALRRVYQRAAGGDR